jgi:MoaA/NifB/PqqE/SkfB family radical SAM enzyme
MPEGDLINGPKLDPVKFKDPETTADGDIRASVDWRGLKTLWFNTGTLCNVTCQGCYIESSPTNDRLAYLSAADVETYLDEIEKNALGAAEIGFTGGEPFMNRELPAMIETSLSRGFRVLVLTNAMKPLHHRKRELRDLRDRFGDALTLRVSIDHYRADEHERLRGPNSWAPMIDGVTWLAENGFSIAVAGRTCWPEPEDALRRGYARLFSELGLAIDADDPISLVLFPEMDDSLDVAEITTACWGILGVDPAAMMCATSRMIIKRKDAGRPTVVPCTLLPYDPAFEMGHDLADALGPVKLNHPHCARFCVLGGGSCSTAD